MTYIIHCTDWKCRSWGGWWSLWCLHQFAGTSRRDLPVLLQNLRSTYVHLLYRVVSA